MPEKKKCPSLLQCTSLHRKMYQTNYCSNNVSLLFPFIYAFLFFRFVLDVSSFFLFFCVWFCHTPDLGRWSQNRNHEKGSMSEEDSDRDPNPEPSLTYDFGSRYSRVPFRTWPICIPGNCIIQIMVLDQDFKNTKAICLLSNQDINTV